jgi:hypothetical protein
LPISITSITLGFVPADVDWSKNIVFKVFRASTTVHASVLGGTIKSTMPGLELGLDGGVPLIVGSPVSFGVFSVLTDNGVASEELRSHFLHHQRLIHRSTPLVKPLA